MPVHDWTRVSAGTFHSFHLGWMAEMTRALNGGLLPADYYALAEQRAGDIDPDLLTLEQHAENVGDADGSIEEHGTGGGTALAVSPPKVRVIGEVDEASLYALKRRTLTIRHATNDRIVALLEIASPANKDRQQTVQRFADKSVAAIQAGFHVAILDLFPPRAHDPAGLASAVWEEIGGDRIVLPVGKPLTAASFRVAGRVQCYAEALAVGDRLPELPLFYDPDWYVTLPLESTYASAYEGVPRRWRRVIEAGEESTEGRS